MKDSKYKVVLLMAIFAVVTTGVLSLNYSGFCWREGQWLSEEENIEAAVARLLEESRIPVHTKTKYTNFRTIPYESKAAFFDANPTCCEYVKTTDYNGFLSLFDKIVGFSSGVVTIQYYQPYIDDANVKASNTFEADVVMSPCGVAKHLRQSYNKKIGE